MLDLGSVAFTSKKHYHDFRCCPSSHSLATYFAHLGATLRLVGGEAVRKAAYFYYADIACAGIHLANAIGPLAAYSVTG